MKINTFAGSILAKTTVLMGLAAGTMVLFRSARLLAVGLTLGLQKEGGREQESTSTCKVR